MDLAIRNGTVVTTQGRWQMDIGVQSGRVVALTEQGHLRGDEEIDATGLYVLPGGIDPHCHCGEPGLLDRENYITATKSAAAGGITTFIDQPLTRPSTTTRAAFEQKLEIIKHKALVDYSLWGGLVSGSIGEVPGLIEAGTRGFKAFMKEDSVYPMLRDGELLYAMQQVAQLGGVVSLHAENNDILVFNQKMVTAQGRKDPMAFMAVHTPFSEYEAIHRALLLAKEANATLHIVHMGHPGGAQLIKEARMAGQSVSVEATPHNLTLNETTLQRLGPYGLCTPPLRNQAMVNGLWSYVLDGTIDMIASDHSPHPDYEKEPGFESIFAADEGMPMVQTQWPSILNEGVNKRGLALEAFVKLTSYNAARRFGLYPKKGTIAIGSDADFALIDLNGSWTVRKEDLFYKNPWSPYIGMTLKGVVKKTIVRGRVVYDGGRFLVEPGYGEFNPMRYIGS